MRRAVPLAAAVLAATVATACSSGTPHGSASTPSTPAVPVAASTAAASTVAVRWWSNSAEQSGSVIDASDPAAAAAKLTPSRTSYCTMLRQTLAAGHSVLPGAAAADPAYATTTTAFVAELQHVAPAGVAPSWRVLGTVLAAVVDPSGPHLAAGLDRQQVVTAAATVRSDATQHCGLDLSAH